MSLEKHNDSSITIIKNNVVKLMDDKWEEKFQQWVQECAKLVTANTHTFKEIEQYFLEQCDALPITTNDIRMKSFQLDVVINHCTDKLKHQASEFSFDRTEEEIEKWHEEENAMRKEVMDSSPEHFGLNIRGYYLPHTELNEVFYEQSYQEVQKFMKHTNQDGKQVKIQDICFFFEETTGHYHFSGVGSLKNQLIVFIGVSKVDIEKHSQRFLAYIDAMHEMGKLPSFIADK
jgi:hypothetical protein